jgi:hypothetical protein
VTNAEIERDTAYRERAQLLAWLAVLYPSVIAPAPDIDEPDWQVLYLTAGGKQMSWHIAPRDVDLFMHVKHVAVDDSRAQWDGHTTEEKYWRIRSLTFGEMNATQLVEAHAAGVAEGRKAGRDAVADMLDSRFDADGYGKWQDGWRAAAYEARQLRI